MATFAPVLLSGSTDGKPISITGTAAGSADTLHTCVSGSTSFDEVWLWVCNRDTVARTLHLSFGDTSLDAIINIPPNVGWVPITFGVRANNGVVVKAWASVTAVLAIVGNINRYTP